MATMGEIMKDPSKATEEDVKAMRDINSLVNSLKEKMEPYQGFNINAGRPIKKLLCVFIKKV